MPPCAGLAKMAVSVALIGLFASWPALAQPSAEQAGIARVRALLADNPRDAALHFSLAARLARVGQLNDALRALERAATLADGLLPITATHFPALRADPRYARLHQALQARLPRCGLGAEAVALGAGLAFPEGLTADPLTKRLFIGSAMDGSVHVTDDTGAARLWARGDGHGVLGLAVDAAGRRLFAVRPSDVSPDGPPVSNAVLVFDLDSGQPIRVLEIKDAAFLNDVAVLSADALLVTDSDRGLLWRVPTDGSPPQALLADGALPSANGLAVDAQRSRVYVAHGRGVAVGDLRSGKWVHRMPSASRELLASIDGLIVKDGALLGVQNSTHPGRVLRLGLDAVGDKVQSVQTLVSHHHPAMQEPTTLVEMGGAVWVLGRTSLSQLGRQGPPQGAPNPPRPEPMLLKLALGADAACVGP